MSVKEIEFFYPSNRQQWREWLQENHAKKQSVWLIHYKIKSSMPTISWSEAVDEALCFGWIDSKAKPINEEKYMQFFSKRKAISTWSKVNKEKVQKLIDGGTMTKAGLEIIEIAKQNGSWAILDEVEALIIPTDLEDKFNTQPGTKNFFLSLSKSVRKNTLQWLVLAKRQETRQKRIKEIVELAALNLKPNQFR
ncbi:MAG: YdeI/OmpD-associated family protein [Candidatus Amoebophilus sp.]